MSDTREQLAKEFNEMLRICADSMPIETTAGTLRTWLDAELTALRSQLVTVTREREEAYSTLQKANIECDEHYDRAASAEQQMAAAQQENARLKQVCEWWSVEASATYSFWVGHVIKVVKELRRAESERDEQQKRADELYAKGLEILDDHQKQREERFDAEQQVSKLRDALKSLNAEVAGAMTAFESGIRQAIGNTNHACIMDKLAEADKVLSLTVGKQISGLSNLGGQMSDPRRLPTKIDDALANFPKEYGGRLSYDYEQVDGLFHVYSNNQTVCMSEDSEVAHAICLLINEWLERYSQIGISGGGQR